MRTGRLAWRGWTLLRMNTGMKRTRSRQRMVSHRLSCLGCRKTTIGVSIEKIKPSITINDWLTTGSNCITAPSLCSDNRLWFVNVTRNKKNNCDREQSEIKFPFQQSQHQCLIQDKISTSPSPTDRRAVVAPRGRARSPHWAIFLLNDIAITNNSTFPKIKLHYSISYCNKTKSNITPSLIKCDSSFIYLTTILDRGK